MLRPRRLAEEAQGRPAESVAFYGKKQRCSTENRKAQHGLVPVIEGKQSIWAFISIGKQT